MKEFTMTEAVRSMLGVPVCAIPLSVCKPSKSYLLERAGIPLSGTAILFAVPYLMTEDVQATGRNVSLYAVARDYHGYMKELADAVLPKLRCAYPDYRFSLYADHSPISEVDAAARGGLGVMGMNGLLITEEFGSFVFLGEIVTDADYATAVGKSAPSFPVKPPMCEGCGACLRACPGHCISGGRDSCLSAITQKKGVLSAEEIASVREAGLVWGCDICQLVCPHNQRVLNQKKDTPVPYFRCQRILRVDGSLLDEMDDECFRGRAYAWRGRAVLERNIAILQEQDTTQERSPT